MNIMKHLNNWMCVMRRKVDSLNCLISRSFHIVKVVEASLALLLTRMPNVRAVRGNCNVFNRKET